MLPVPAYPPCTPHTTSAARVEIRQKVRSEVCVAPLSCSLSGRYAPLPSALQPASRSARYRELGVFGTDRVRRAARRRETHDVGRASCDILERRRGAKEAWGVTGETNYKAVDSARPDPPITDHSRHSGRSGIRPRSACAAAHAFEACACHRSDRPPSLYPCNPATIPSFATRTLYHPLQIIPVAPHRPKTPQPDRRRKRKGKACSTHETPLGWWQASVQRGLENS